MAGRQQEVSFQRQMRSLGSAARKAAKTEFPLQTRNRMAADLQLNEHVLDDDFVAISRERPVRKLMPKRSTPEFGMASATSARLRLVFSESSEVVDADLRSIRLTHDENDSLTLLITSSAGGTEPMTITFARQRSSVAQHLRRALGGGTVGGKKDGVVRSTLDRLRPGP